MLEYYENTKTGEILYLTDKDLDNIYYNQYFLHILLHQKVFSHMDFDWEYTISNMSFNFDISNVNILLANSNWERKYILSSTHPEIRNSIRNNEMKIILKINKIRLKCVGNNILISTKLWQFGNRSSYGKYYKGVEMGSFKFYNTNGEYQSCIYKPIRRI